MLKLESAYQDYTIKTNDVAILVLLENAIKDKIKQLEHLEQQDTNTDIEKQQYKEDLEKYKEYLQQLQK